MNSRAASPAATVRTAPLRGAVPRVPETIEDTGLSEEVIVDLLLKTMYVHGARTGEQLADALRLPFSILDEPLETLQRRRQIEARGSSGPGRLGYVFDLGRAGRERAREALQISGYVGAAPVPLAQYRRTLESQSIREARVDRSTITAGFRELVLSPALLEVLGPAVNSGRSLLLYGEAGNGKTVIAEAISRLFGGAIYVPYAVEFEGQSLIVYDPICHRPARDGDLRTEPEAAQPSWFRDVPQHDQRYARVERPIVVTGGELRLDDLDLRYDAQSRLYRAPVQVKANGGVLILDDFGRQRVAPRDLLNRWIVPLEKRVDYLTLCTGGTFPLPFDCFLIFATNQEPTDLMEEAFLRRVQYRIHVRGPTRHEYAEILRLCCARRDIPFRPEAVDEVYRTYYERLGIPPRACHPRDLVESICDLARFRGVEPTLSTELLGYACWSYFVEASHAQPT